MTLAPLRRQLAGVFAALLATAPACALEVRTGAQEAAAPKFVAQTVNGKARIGGLCIDIMRALERTEPELKFVGDQHWFPHARLSSGMAHGQFDLLCALIRTPEREALYGFIDTPLFAVDYLLTVRANDDVRVRDWADVRNLGEYGVVLTMHGYDGILSHLKQVGGLHIDAGGRDTRVNLEKLLAGRGRFFVHRNPGIYGEVARSGLQNKVKILPLPMYKENFYMMVARSMPQDTREKINRALLAMTNSGELGSITRQWQDSAELAQ
jgi:polar amino acid transport system substrate-binding protein